MIPLGNSYRRGSVAMRASRSIGTRRTITKTQLLLRRLQPVSARYEARLGCCIAVSPVRPEHARLTLEPLAATADRLPLIAVMRQFYKTELGEQVNRRRWDHRGVL